MSFSFSEQEALALWWGEAGIHMGTGANLHALDKKIFPYKQQPDQDKLYFSWPVFNNLNQIKSFPANYWLFWLNIKLKSLYLAAGNEQFSRHLWRASWFFQSKSALN